MFRKAKEFGTLVDDSTFPFHVGQLIGAAEMASHVLKRHEDAQMQHLGQKLAEVVNWFFKDVPPEGT